MTTLTLTQNSPALEHQQYYCRELAIVDSHVDQWEILAAGVRPDCEVVALHPHEDGIGQITDLLQHRCHHIEGLHIISHGQPGTLYLGNSILNSETLQTRYSKAVQQWRHGLTDNAHILIYGCNVAASSFSSSHTLLKQLHQLTGANISASTTPTGSATKGGNWQLEFTTAKVQPALALSADVMANYPSILEVQIEWAKAIDSGRDKKEKRVAIHIQDNDFYIDNYDPSPMNIFVTGEFDHWIDLGYQGSDYDSQLTLTNDGSRQAYLAIFNYDDSDYFWDSNSNWATVFNSDRPTFSDGIVSDYNGNVFVTGQFQNWIDFNEDGNADLESDYDDPDVFSNYVVKFDKTGNLIWAKDWGDKAIQGVTIDNHSNMFVTGLFEGPIDFDGDGTIDIDNGQHNAYVVKFDSNGSYHWAKSFGNYFEDFDNDGNSDQLNDVQEITTDEHGNVLIAGMFQGAIDLDGDGNVDFSDPYGNGDRYAYLAKFDSAGNYVWGKSFADVGLQDSDRGLATDSNDNVFVSGQFYDQLDLDGDGIVDLDSGNYNGGPAPNAYVAMFDRNGNLAWTKACQSNNNTSINEIGIDIDGNVVITGEFTDAISIDGNYIEDPYPSYPLNKQNASYIAKLEHNIDGYVNVLALSAIGNTESNSSYGITIDNNGDYIYNNDNVFLSGEFSGDFDVNFDGYFDDYEGYDMTPYYSGDAYVAQSDYSAITFAGSEFTSGRSGIATDNNGNFFATKQGSFPGQFDSNGNYSPDWMSNHGKDPHVAKFDSSGNLVWEKSFSDSDDSYSYGMASNNGITADSNGNVWVTGMFSGDIDLDEDGYYDLLAEDDGPTDDLTQNEPKAYVAQFDSNGNLVWAKDFSDSDSNSGQAVAADSDGNVFVTGEFRGDIYFDFDFSVGIDVDGDGNPDWWGTDLNGDGLPEYPTENYYNSDYNNATYLAKYDSSGNLTWAIGFESPESNSGQAVATDSDGNVVITGQHEGEIYSELDSNENGYYDDGIGHSSYGGGSPETYVAQFDSNGKLTWSHTFASMGMPEENSSAGVATDNIGNVFVTGMFYGEIDFDFDPVNGDFNPDLYGDYENPKAYVVKFDHSGNLSWALGFQSEIFHDVQGITTDNSGNVFVTGQFQSDIDFDGDGVLDLITNAYGDTETYVAQFDNSGNLIEAKILEADEASATDITTDSSGKVLVTGEFSGQMKDGDYYDDYLTSDYTDAAYVTKLAFTNASTNQPPTSADTSITLDEDSPYTFAESDFPFADLEGQTLQAVTITQLPTVGTFALDGIAVTLNQVISVADLSNLVFTPAADSNGTNYDSFKFTVNDGFAYSASEYTLTVNVNPVNDSPVISTVSKSGIEDTDITFVDSDFSAAFADADDDSLSQVKITSLPENGTLKLNDIAVVANQEITAADIANLTFTPDANYNGTTSFTWNASDGSDYAETDAEVILSVGVENDLPVISDVSLSGDEDSNITFVESDFTAGFSDLDGDSLSKIKITSLPENGNLKLNDIAVAANQEIDVSNLGNLIFVPDANYNGSTSFTWNGFDGITYADTDATVNLTVAAGNDAPTLSTVTLSGNEGNINIAFTESDFTDAFTDVDGGSLSQIKITSLPENGTLKLNDTAVTVDQEIAAAELNNLSFIPDVGFSGNISFTWNGSDGTDYADADAIVNVLDIDATNNPPAIANSVFNQGFGFHNGGQFTFAADSYVDSDPGDSITYSIAAADTLSYSWYDWETATNGAWYRQPKEGIVFPEVELPSWLTFDPETRTINIDEAARPDSFRYGLKVTGSDRFGESVSEFIWFKSSELGGFIIDNYIAGATVFWDANKNGVQDANEPSTTSDQTGEFDLNVSIEDYDTNNNGILDPEEGQIVAFGGIDTATGLPLETPITATPESTVVTLLTTLVADLVNQGVDVNDANEQVVAALSIPSEVDISSLDPIAATNSNSPGAQETLVAMAKVQNSVTQVANLISGATTTENHVVVQNVIEAFTSQIQAGSSIDVSNANQLAEIIEQAATTTQQSDPNLDKQQIENVKADAATVMAAANQKIDNIVSTAGTNPDPSQLQFQIAQVQFVALGETSQDLEQAGANSKPIADVVAENTGDVLEAQVEVALTDATLADETTSDDSSETISDDSSETTSDDSSETISDDSSETASDDSSETISDDASESDAVSPVGPAPASSFLPVNIELVLDTEETEKGTENNDTLTGDSGQDIFLGLSGNDVLNGLEGDDWMNGNRGEDTLFGGSGDDTLYGGKDFDIINGEDGEDVAFGNWGNDSLTGGDGNDFLNGNQENDTVNGGLGNDTLHGGKNEDNLFGGDGSDVMFGDLGNDVITGEDGDDFLNGNRGEDNIIGGNGNDTLHGGKDNDILNGGEGNDLLCGDIGNDLVTGGNGEDIFALQLGHGADEIIDFANGVDLIGLARGLTLADLSITGSNGHTLISSNNELLATLTGIDVSSIDRADFVLV